MFPISRLLKKVQREGRKGADEKGLELRLVPSRVQIRSDLEDCLQSRLRMAGYGGTPWDRTGPGPGQQAAQIRLIPHDSCTALKCTESMRHALKQSLPG